MQNNEKNIHLSVVIPAYNEEENLKFGVSQELFKYLEKQSFSWEVIFVDDGSKDSTVRVLEDITRSRTNVRVLKEPHRGKGGTVIAGMFKAVGEIILFCDMDQATPISELDKILPKFRENYDVVIGSRKGREGAPFLRKIMAWGFSVLRTLVLRLPFKDTQCGFKAFKKDAARNIFEKMKIFRGSMLGEKTGVTAGFDLELLYIARKLGLRIAEVEVVWHHKESERVTPLRDSWEGLRDLVRIRLNALAGKYK